MSTVKKKTSYSFIARKQAKSGINVTRKTRDDIWNDPQRDTCSYPRNESEFKKDCLGCPKGSSDMSVRGIPTDISLRGAKKWNTLFNFSLRSCKRMLWYSSRKEKGILTLNSGCWHRNQMEIEMKLQPDTNSKKISNIVPDLQTTFSNYNCTWTYWSFKPPMRYQHMELPRDLLLKDWTEIFFRNIKLWRNID